MIETLNSYLVQHKRIGIPGLGTLYVEQSSARADPENHRLMPHSFAYRFNKFQDTPPTEFFPFVAAQMDVAEYEAIRLYNEFSASLCSEIKQYDRALWPEMGVFRKDESGEVYFEQFPRRFSLFDPVDTTQWNGEISAVANTSTVNEEAVLADIPEYRNSQLPEESSRSLSWWVYVLIALALLAVAALALHLYTDGAIWQQWLNRL